MAAIVYKTRSWIRVALSDTANLPLLAANLGGFSLICYFGGRKLFTHPDVRVDVFERSIQETTPSREPDALSFRNYSGMFGRILAPINDALQSFTLAGRGRRDEFWHKAELKTEVTPALEHTNYFDDGLFKNKQPALPPTGVMHCKDDK